MGFNHKGNEALHNRKVQSDKSQLSNQYQSTIISSKSHQDNISSIKNKIDNYNSNISFNGIAGPSDKDLYDKRQKKKLEYDALQYNQSNSHDKNNLNTNRIILHRNNENNILINTNNADLIIKNTQKRKME